MNLICISTNFSHKTIIFLISFRLEEFPDNALISEFVHYSRLLSCEPNSIPIYLPMFVIRNR
jgi:hypothetical protein